MSVKNRMLAFLQRDEGRNTFTTAQARTQFGITNVAARVAELRQEGNVIYSNKRRMSDGSEATVYRLGTPRKAFVRDALALGLSL